MGLQRVGNNWGTEQNWIYTKEYHLVSSFAQSCLSPGYQQLLELVQTHVHRVSDAMKEYHLVLKRKKILTHGSTWMKLKDIVLSKRSQAPSYDKYRMIPLMWGFSTRQMHTQAHLDYHASLYCFMWWSGTEGAIAPLYTCWKEVECACQGPGRWEMESYYWKDTEIQFCKMEKFWKSVSQQCEYT